MCPHAALMKTILLASAAAMQNRVGTIRWVSRHIIENMSVLMASFCGCNVEEPSLYFLAGEEQQQELAEQQQQQHLAC